MSGQEVVGVLALIVMLTAIVAGLLCLLDYLAHGSVTVRPPRRQKPPVPPTQPGPAVSDDALRRHLFKYHVTWQHWCREGRPDYGIGPGEQAYYDKREAGFIRVNPADYLFATRFQGRVVTGVYVSAPRPERARVYVLGITEGTNAPQT